MSPILGSPAVFIFVLVFTHLAVRASQLGYTMQANRSDSILCMLDYGTLSVKKENETERASDLSTL